MPDQIALVVKSIRAGKARGLFDDKAFRAELRRINQKTARAMKRSFGQTTRTWAHPVDFHQMTESQPDPTVLVYTTDAVYGYVSGGTRVRRALMSPAFSPKTRPGVLDSRPGRGGVVFVSRRLALPGIQARRFPELVEAKHLRPYQRQVEEALSRALQRKR